MNETNLVTSDDCGSCRMHWNAKKFMCWLFAGRLGRQECGKILSTTAMWTKIHKWC